MKNLFRRHQKADETGAPPEGAPEKRSYVFLLEFRCRGRLVVSARTDSMGRVLRIGRAPENDWVIPPQDRVSADYEAELRLGNREIRLQACGKNGFHVRGKTLTSYVLKGNDRIAIGDCELFVKPAEISDSRPCDVHRLEFRNGPREGELVRLEKKLVRIGSAPENDIVIRDDVVSRFHAEIRIAENGESWIRDLDSVNGTFVNGARLGRQERMLMDSDEISIAFFDLMFLDRNVPHTRSQIGRKILIMGITVLVILGVFGLFYAMTPEASQVLNAAEFYIRKADFPAARRMLDRMPEARNYPKYEKHYQEHLKNIARYEKTLACWKEFQRLLKNSEWQDAAQCFGRLEVDNRFAWNWEDATVDERMALVRHAKSLLDVQFRIRALLLSMDSDPAAQKKMFEELKKDPLLAPRQEPEWLLPLREEIRKLLAELENNCSILDRMTAVLDRLEEENTDFRKRITELENLRRTASGSVRVRAQDLADVLKKLEKNQEAVSKNQAALTAMRFKAIQPEIPFVSPDECMISSRILQKRARLVQRQEDLLQNAENLNYLLGKLRKAGLTPGKVPEIVERFSSETEIRKALNFECLNGKVPNPRRKTPEGMYDRMFGIRFFYEIIQQSAVLPTNLYSGEIVSSLDFYPECISLAELYRAVEETRLWLSLPENQWMQSGETKKLNNLCETLLARRNAMLDMLNRIAQSAPGTRTWFVAKAALFYFSPASSIPRNEMQNYAAQWKVFRSKQQKLLEGYDPLKPEKARKIGETILKEGIPGDPVVNWIWSQIHE